MRGPSRRGFTLIELIVALTVISVGLIATASTMGHLIRFQHSQTMRTEMTLLAKDKLDSLRFAGETGIGGGIQFGGSLDLATRVSGFSELVARPNGRSYWRLWEVTLADVPVGTVGASVRVLPVGDMSAVPIDVRLSTLLPTRQ
ncbi:MAG: hypothetical protein RLZZ63_891 [Gemmatimonadota bacterium]|jgi:prepilin-type N-terminal cleavage/methylation domain-containing protein